MIKGQEEFWLRSRGRVMGRGLSVSGFIARRELRTASFLISRFCTELDGPLLDLGAGTGMVWGYANSPKFRVSFDLMPFSEEHNKDTRCVRGDAAILPFKTASISSIVALGLLEYLGGLEESLREWRRVARSGAILVFTNSPPILPNLARAWFGYRAIPRADASISLALISAGWKAMAPSPVLAGWQSIWAAKAV